MSFLGAAGLSRVSPHLEGAPVLCVDAADLDADAVTLDALARLALAARRRGYRVLVQNASSDLGGLIELAGLSEALPVARLRPGSTRTRC